MTTTTLPVSLSYDVHTARSDEGACWLVQNSITNTIMAICFEKGHADMIAMALNHLSHHVDSSLAIVRRNSSKQKVKHG